MLVEAAERAVAPADVKAFAVAMDALVQWVEVFGVIPLPADPDKREAQIGAIVAGYRAPLADLPADVLVNAVRATIANHQFRTLPMPADIRKYAEAELRERQARMLRLKTAQQIAERQAKTTADYAFPRERTHEQIAGFSAVVAAVSRIDAAPKAMPTERSDLHPEDDDRRAAILRVQQETRGLRRIPKPWEAKQ
ncbi:hypothetical protein TSH7_01405 [Azospirillum sp. TSH7]|uniref:hypothetical protein n=1 Tax=Azospirillum sp. TSH20 TaxID=652754 RepID=UPI000D6044CF|nr:hypothetical protein [Azospirillum sp. TSH20]PWC69129.1 hypothetical protein TSH7_01405 [Azospirillum sp. TSH7]PWC71379.1 hypothetical protein TSH20_03670 [Azospirillum sp. TSH20]